MIVRVFNSCRWYRLSGNFENWLKSRRRVVRNRRFSEDIRGRFESLLFRRSRDTIFWDCRSFRFRMYSLQRLRSISSPLKFARVQFEFFFLVDL